ncbi:MAG: membrane protein insertion efficiency factor YidD [Deltaproteobacteria bacterium]|nr:membrane protein insertion efficiency factor YidD [Deltaproteobacteria bacterium]
MKFIKTLFLIFSFCFLFTGTAAADGDPIKGPWEQNANNRSAPTHDFSLNPLKCFVKFYRNYISPIDGKECPMHPSCSRYSIDCFEKHGLIIGWMMTCDRLFHEPDEMEQAPMILVNGHYKFYDPVENNDFWWYDKRQKAQKAENRRQKTEDRSQRLGDCGI